MFIVSVFQVHSANFSKTILLVRIDDVDLISRMFRGLYSAK